ncbi:SH3 domain-containing protein [Streptococcus vestibularis]|nr:SH3 domain-containing protein [Streptococcus vestibularis]MCB8588161.1 SH3 domain-containing protein [Streptococcus vestibularis]
MLCKSRNGVFYDQVVTADTYQWLSYVTVSGARRYVDIS